MSQNAIYIVLRPVYTANVIDTARSQIGGAAVRLLVFRAGGLGSNPRSDYKGVALVA